MENDVDLPLVRYEFKNGSEEKQAFVNICRDHEMEPPLDSTVSNWFERFCKFDGSLKREIEEFHYNLISAIILQYAKFNYAIFCHYDDVWNAGSDAIIRNRFNLVSDGATKSFTVFDTFTEGLKMVRTTIDEHELSSFYFPVLINHERILLNVVRGNDEYLLLLNADFDDLNCSVLDETSIDIICQQIILDSTDNLRFLLRVGEIGDDTSVQRRYVSDNRIHLEYEEILFETGLFCCKLEGDQLFAFQRKQGNATCWIYVEYDLSSNLVRKVNEWHCCGFQGHEKVPHSSQQYVWSSNKLYAVRNFAGHFAISTFDSDTLTWSKTNFIGAGYVNKLTVDEDHILTISATENRYESYIVKAKTVYRIPMRKPDKLRYIAWFKIRREVIFSGSKLGFLLPYTSEFREFSDNY